MTMSPAEHVIRAFGGVRATARAVKREPSTICKWRRPKSKKGTGGAIPRGVQQTILKLAKARKLDITISDIIYGR